MTRRPSAGEPAGGAERQALSALRDQVVGRTEIARVSVVTSG